MSEIFNLPDLGEGLPDAEIVEWHVKEGDTVKVDQSLVSMETAKAVVEVPAPHTGKIIKLHGQPGDIIQTGSPLVEFDISAETSKTAATKPKKPAEKQAQNKSVDIKEDAGTVVGSVEITDTILQESATGIIQGKSATQTIKAMPGVRALAKMLDVDLTQITATGAEGQITANDVKQAVSFSSAGQQPTRAIPTAEPVKETYIDALRGVRRAMANAMAQSQAEVAPVSLVDDADIHAWPKGTDITARIIRAVVVGCCTEPALNAHFDMQKLERKVFKEINIGIAMDSKEGLFVPVLKNAEQATPAIIRKTIERFKTEVKSRSIPADDLKGSTIQLSNFGALAGRYANPMLVPPIVAILGTGKIRDEVVAHAGMIAIHRVLPLSITIDHRAVTGGEAARFLAAMIADLQKVS